jgi:O-antigen/teichoic acid export membrane protein
MGSLTAQNLGTSILGFVFQISILHLIPETQYGVYSAVSVVIGIAGSFATFGLSQAVARYIALLRQQDEQRSWVAVRKILYLVLGLTVAVTAVYLIISPELSLYFTKETTWTSVFLLGAVWLFLTSLSNVCQGIIQGLRRYTLLARMLFIPKLVMVLFTLVALIFYRNVEVAILAWIVYSLMIVVWTLAATAGSMVHAKGRFEYSEVLKYTSPLGIAAIVAVISSSADLVVVGGYLNSNSLGVYTAAITVSSILGALFVTPLTTALLPELSSSKSDNDISNGVRLALRFAILLVLPASLLVAALSNQLIELFSGGGAYLAGSPSLELIALFYLFVALQTILVVLFQAIGKTVNAMVVGFATAATDIGLAVLLVPSLGLLGAASAKVCVGVVGAMVGFYYARKYLGRLDKASFYFKALVAALVPFVLTLGLSHYVSIRLVTLFPYAIVYAVIFIACVKFLKLLNSDDRAFISHILPKFMQRLTNLL